MVLYQRRLPNGGRAAASVESTAIEASTVADLFDDDTALRRVAGDRELLQALVGLLGERQPQLMEAIQSVIRKQVAVRLRQAAHTLKGKVGNFRARASVEAALRLEMMGYEGNLTNADEAYTALEHVLDRLMPVLIAFGQVKTLSEEEDPYGS